MVSEGLYTTKTKYHWKVNVGVNKLPKVIEEIQGERISYYAEIMNISEKTIEHWLWQLW